MAFSTKSNVKILSLKTPTCGASLRRNTFWRGPMRSSHADRPPHQITSATSIIEVPLRNSITINYSKVNQNQPPNQFFL